MDKVTLNLDGDTATIEEGKNSFMGQLLAQAGKVRINTNGIQREATILSSIQPKASTKTETLSESPIEDKPKKSWFKRGK